MISWLDLDFSQGLRQSYVYKSKVAKQVYTQIISSEKGNKSSIVLFVTKSGKYYNQPETEIFIKKQTEAGVPNVRTGNEVGSNKT